MSAVESKKPNPPAQPPTPAASRPTAAVAAFDPEVDAVIHAIGFIYFNTINGRWFSATDCRQTLVESFSVITTVLEKLGKLRFTANNGEIEVNGCHYDAQTQHMKALVAYLSSLGGCNFTFVKDVTLVEFTTFMDFLCNSTTDASPLADFTEAVNLQGLPHITSRKVVLREVSEEEAVVAKEVLESVAEEEKKRIESDVLALLSAEKQEVSTAQAASLRQAVDDSARMADLIMQTVEKKQGDSATVDKQRVTQMVVECLDRAFGALLDDPFSKTQKGKKAIASALQHLETELLAKMEVRPEQEESHTVTSAVERMTERLKMDSIVQDYTKKLKALESSEKQILRFIKLQGLDRIKDTELEKKLGDEGVDVSDVHRLLAISGAETGEDAAAAVTQLAELLSRLDQDVTTLQKTPDPETQEQIAGDLKEVNSQISALTQRTQVKIDGLVDALAADMDAVDAIEQEAERSGQHLRMSRRKMLAILGEVVQELRQPLSVISCSIGMLTTKTLGDVSPVQLEMLQLVDESTQKIRTLIGNMERIAGRPSSLDPDNEVQRALNQRPSPGV